MFKHLIPTSPGMKRWRFRISFVVLLIACLAFFRCCDTRLGNGFKLVNDKFRYYITGPVFVDSPTGRVTWTTNTLIIPPHISRFFGTERFVTGVITSQPLIQYTDFSPPGLFVLDLKTGERRMSLTEAEWSQWLADRGVDPNAITLRRTYWRLP